MIIMGAQIFSGLTAAFAIAVIVLSNTHQLGLWVGLGLAAIAALFLVSLIEGGLFHIAPFVFRQMVRGKFSNRYYIGMFVLLFPIVGILASSTTFLSFVGSPYLVEIATPKHEVENLETVDKRLVSGWNDQSGEFEAEKAQINGRFADQIASTKKGFKAKIKAKLKKAKAVKESHPQWSAGIERQAEKLAVQMDERIAQIKENRNKQLAKVTEAKTSTLLAHNSHKKLIVSTAANGNRNRETKRANLVSSSGGFVKYFAVFCTIITIFGLLLLEVHEAGKLGVSGATVSLNPFSWFQAKTVSSFSNTGETLAKQGPKPQKLKPETVETETPSPIKGITQEAISETVSIVAATETDPAKIKIKGIETLHDVALSAKRIQQYKNKIKNDSGNMKTNRIRIAQHELGIKLLS